MRGPNRAPRPVLPTVPATKPFDEWKPCQVTRRFASWSLEFDWCWVHEQTPRMCVEQREALAK